MPGDIVRKKYEAFVVLVLFYAIFYALLRSRCMFSNPYSALMVGPSIFSIVTFSFLLFPPRKYPTLFAVALETSILNACLVVGNFPNYCRPLLYCSCATEY